MTNPKSDIKELFIEEINDTLFESLDFNIELKEEAKKKIYANKKIQTRFWKTRKNRVYGLAMGAAVICLMVVSTTIFLNTDSDKSEGKTLKDTNMTTFNGEAKNDNVILEPTGMKTQELSTENEAKQLFGNDLLLPTYIPSPFVLDRINAKSEGKEKVNKVIFTYTAKDQVYSVMIERSKMNNIPLGFQEVDINGVKGYLKKDESIENSDAELDWYMNDIHYMVNGLITSDEAKKIAQSLK
jgi:hypothetical protein